METNPEVTAVAVTDTPPRRRRATVAAVPNEQTEATPAELRTQLKRAEKALAEKDSQISMLTAQAAAYEEQSKQMQERMAFMRDYIKASHATVRTQLQTTINVLDMLDVGMVDMSKGG